MTLVLMLESCAKPCASSGRRKNVYEIETAKKRLKIAL